MSTPNKFNPNGREYEEKADAQPLLSSFYFVLVVSKKIFPRLPRVFRGYSFGRLSPSCATGSKANLEHFQTCHPSINRVSRDVVFSGTVLRSGKRIEQLQRALGFDNFHG